MTAAVGTQEYAREMAALARDVARPLTTGEVPRLEPLNLNERSGNELRPATFDEMVGQTRLRPLLERLVDTARSTGQPLDHMLFCGGAGTGKTTAAQVVAHELNRPCFMLKAPIAQDMLEALSRSANDGDIVIVDEFHMIAKGDRRGANPVAAPENMLLILEDHRLQTATQVVPFPQLCWIGCTTDVGLIPEPVIMRFPLQPKLDAYTVEEMMVLASRNARQLRMVLTDAAGQIFARACGGTPRVLNRFVRNARSLGAKEIDRTIAVEIVEELNGYTLDGLAPDAQAMLKFLLMSRRTDAKGNVSYVASVSGIATATGHSRDAKAVQLYVEPVLVERGYVAVTSRGRALTDAGIRRAREL